MRTNLLKHKANSKAWYIIRAFYILILILSTTCFVYLKGGTGNSFTHIMYIPIILSSYYFGMIGTIGAALLGGFALGPFMPHSVLSKSAQQPASWIFRLAIFTIIGMFSAILFKRINNYKKDELERSHINFLTGLPNIYKLELDLDELIDKKTEFSLIGFRIENLNSINQNISYEIGLKSIKKVLKFLSKSVNGTVYSTNTNEFAIVLPGSSVENARIIGEQFLNETLEPFVIDQVNIGLLIKGGIVNFPLNAADAYDLIQKMGIALDQAKEDIGLYVYDDVMEQKSKGQAELVPLLLNAIKNEEFYLVYQPKKSLRGDSIYSVEALLRWNNCIRGQISPGEFIKTAEETGLIGEITKWVIKNVIEQKEAWKKAGMPVKIALNISAKDLNDSDVVSFFKEMIENKELDLSLLEIELTERGMLKNMDKIIPFFNELRARGIKIALDDFGTGYNSLINLVQVPADYIKIDKTFIDGIMENTYKLAVECTIDYAHRLGRKVIAEGVESKEQLDILKNIGCDYIQGYYLSKPLPPVELRNFYFVEGKRHQLLEC